MRQGPHQPQACFAQLQAALPKTTKAAAVSCWWADAAKRDQAAEQNLQRKARRAQGLHVTRMQQGAVRQAVRLEHTTQCEVIGYRKLTAVTSWMQTCQLIKVGITKSVAAGSMLAFVVPDAYALADMRLPETSSLLASSELVRALCTDVLNAAWPYDADCMWLCCSGVTTPSCTLLHPATADMSHQQMDKHTRTKHGCMTPSQCAPGLHGNSRPLEHAWIAERHMSELQSTHAPESGFVMDSAALHMSAVQIALVVGREWLPVGPSRLSRQKLAKIPGQNSWAWCRRCAACRCSGSQYLHLGSGLW